MSSAAYERDLEWLADWLRRYDEGAAMEEPAEVIRSLFSHLNHEPPAVSGRRWWFAYCDREELQAFLEDGFEPFAIDARPGGVGLGRQVTVYLRKPVDQDEGSTK